MQLKALIFLIIFLFFTPIIQSYAKDNNEIEFFIKDVNDASYKSTIYMNFKLDVLDLDNKKIQCIVQNGHKKDSLYIIDDEYVFFIQKNYEGLMLYNKSIEKKMQFYGENIYYPLDEYLLNITYVFNATLFNDVQNPFDIRTWPGDWASKTYEYNKTYEENCTIINLQLILVRASVEKTLFSFFYPSFYMIIGIISLLDITEDKGKYRIYITMFLSIVSTMIFFFSKMPAKSGLNLVIITTVTTSYILIYLFANDVFIDKLKGKFLFSYSNSLIFSTLILIIFHIGHLYGLIIYHWMNKINIIRYLFINIISLNGLPIFYQIITTIKNKNDLLGILNYIKKIVHVK